MKRDDCAICGAPLSEHAQSELCKNCRGWRGRWKKRPLGAVAAYRGRLQRGVQRMEDMFPGVDEDSTSWPKDRKVLTKYAIHNQREHRV